jgi:hypothetical protein
VAAASSRGHRFVEEPTEIQGLGGDLPCCGEDGGRGANQVRMRHESNVSETALAWPGLTRHLMVDSTYGDYGWAAWVCLCW